MIPHRLSRVPCPQMRTVGVVIGDGCVGRREDLEKSRVRFVLASSDRALWYVWRVLAFRKAVAKFDNVEVSWDRLDS